MGLRRVWWFARSSLLRGRFATETFGECGSWAAGGVNVFGGRIFDAGGVGHRRGVCGLFTARFPGFVFLVFTWFLGGC